MPIPKPSGGESRGDFMSRCVSFLASEGGYSNDQRVAICSSQWSQGKVKSDGEVKDIQKSLATKLATRGERLNLERKFFLDVFPFTARWYDRIANVFIESGTIERVYISAQVLGSIAATESGLKRNVAYRTLIDETLNNTISSAVEELLNDPMRREWLDKIRDWKYKSFDLGAVHALRLMGFQAEGEFTSFKAAETPVKFHLSNQQLIMDMDILAIPAVSSIMATTIKEARTSIRNTIFIQGKNVDEAIKQVRAMHIMSRAEALKIVRTETQAGYGLGMQQVYEKSGVEKKEWWTVGDHRVRASHTSNAVDGEIPVQSMFSSGQKHPGDVSGGVHNMVNCRCSLIPVKGQSVISPWTGY